MRLFDWGWGGGGVMVLLAFMLIIYKQNGKIIN